MENDNINKKLKDQEFDEKLSFLTKRLVKKEPPDHLWSNIFEEISSKSEKRIKSKKSIFEAFSYFLVKRKGYAISYALVIFVIFISLYFFSNRKDNLEITSTTITSESSEHSKILDSNIIEKKINSPLKSNMVKMVKQPERANSIAFYENRIKKLTSTAERKKENVDPYLRSIYNQKLDDLDESIMECKSGLNENNLNEVVKNSLIYVFNEKINVLLKIIKS